MSKNINVKSSRFYTNLANDFHLPNDAFGQKMLSEYGAMFVARGEVTPPNTVLFKNEEEVIAFQSSVAVSSENIGGIKIELQTAAMNRLKDAIAEAARHDLTVTPRGKDAARRSYGETVCLWHSRVEPGLLHWVGSGKLSLFVADKIRELSPLEQIPEILRLEEKGLFFAKDLSKSIIYSVAPPGTSQHLSMLALDIDEFDNTSVREIMARRGWHQTVISDLPHFTYLGAPESELPDLGLKKVFSGGRFYWIPNL